MINNFKKKFTSTVIASILTLGAIPFANAASINVSKLRLVLNEDKNSDYITLSNAEKNKTSFENTVFKWSQKDGYVTDTGVVPAESVLEETENVFISPSTVVIMGEKNRTLRAIIEDKDEALKDFSYRVQIKQLNTKETPVQTNTISLLFNISIPLFIESETPKKAEEFNITSKFQEIGKTKKQALLLKNNEKQHIQILGIYEKLEAPENNKESEDKFYDVNGYILPNVTNAFELPAEISDRKEFRIKTDKGDLIVSK